MLVGVLGHESIRGSQSYSFKYSPEWLNSYAGIILSDDIRNYPGVQYTQPIEDESRMGGFRFCTGFVRHTTGPDRSSLGLPVKPAMTEYASRRNTRYRNDRYDNHPPTPTPTSA